MMPRTRKPTPHPTAASHRSSLVTTAWQYACKDGTGEWPGSGWWNAKHRAALYGWLPGEFVRYDCISATRTSEMYTAGGFSESSLIAHSGTTAGRFVTMYITPQK